MKMKTPPVIRRLALFLLALLSALSLATVQAASPSIWNGGGANDNWSNADNWNGNVPVPDIAYDLQFGGTTRLTPFNDFSDLSNFGSLTFDAGAGAFTLSGNSITLNGSVANNSTSLQTINHPIVATVAHTVTTSAGGGDVSLGGNISGTGGGLTKAGAGTLTLSGANTYSGATVVTDGTLAITGSLTNSGVLTLNYGTVNISGAIGSGGGNWVVNGSDKAVLNIRSGAAINKAAGNFQVGSVAGSSSALNVTGGTFTTRTAWGFNNFSIGSFGYGSFTVSGGSVDTRGFMLGSGNGTTGVGIGTIAGGTVTVDNNTVVPYYAGTGVLTVGTNGTLRRTSGSNNLNVNQHGNGRGELNLTGGTIENGNGFLGFGTGTGAAAGGTGIVNLNAGSLTTLRFNATSLGVSLLNFNGATLRPAASRTDFVPATITSAFVNGPFGSFAGGAVIDTADFAVTIAEDLLAPAGEGVSALAVIDGGSGYIGAPYVSIVDSGTGLGATAIAEMVDDGTGNGTLKVASIKVTNPGVDYTTATASYSLTGGAPAIPAVPGTVTTTPNTSGGLTKLGTGTLTLTGANSYTGQTTVSQGTLMVNNLNGSGTGAGNIAVKAGAILAGSGTVGGTVTLEDDGTLAPGDGIGTLAVGGNLVLNGGGTINFEITDAVTSDKLIVGGDLTPAGTTTVGLPSLAALAEGDYTLIEVSGALGGDASRFSVTSPTPTKIYSLIYVSGTPNKVVLRVAAAATLLTWTGSAGASGEVWDVGGAMNWVNLGGEPAVFNNNDPVVFNDEGIAHPAINISTAVSPAGVSVSAGGDYTFAGSGHIAGSGAISKAGTGALTLSNANTFSGGIVLSTGTLNLNHPSAAGTGKLTISGGAIGNTSGGPVTLANANPQAWEGDFTFAGNSDLNLGTGAVTPSADRVVTVNGNTLTVGGDISGATGLTKAGPGTLALAGANTYSGGTVVSAGTLAITGSLGNSAGTLTVDGGNAILSGPVDTGTGAWLVGSTGIGVLKTAPGAAIMKNGHFRIGVSAGSSGAVNFTGGSYTNLLAWSFNNFAIGVLGYGALTVSGGDVDSRGFLLGCGNDPASTGIGTISGGSVTVDASVVLPYYTGTATLTIATNGTITRTGAGNLNINHKGNGRGELNLTGGMFDNGNGFVHFGTGPSAAAGGSGILNLDAGSLRTAAFTNYLGDGRLNFNGATLQSSASRTDFLPATMTSVYVNGPFGSFAGGAVIDTAGFDDAIGANLLAPTGDGVSTLAVTDGGSGYIGAPYVSIVDASAVGFGATAIAEMVDDGTGNATLKVASIKVTNPGVNYTAATTSFTLTGGAPITPATPGAVTTVPNTSGGLTKLGEGTLTLSGANTYTGPTVVNAGVLAVDGSLAAESAVTVVGGALSGSGSVGGPVTVQSGGALAPGTSIGTLTLGKTLTLSADSTTIMELDKNAGSHDLVVVAETVNYGGQLAVTNLAGTLAVGDTFSLFSAPAHNGTFSKVAVAGGTGMFDPATGVLTITGTMADYPTNISFSFTSGHLFLNWPDSHKGWYAQSNSVDVADSQEWFDIPGSEAITSLDIPVNASAPMVFYRLRKP